MSFAEELRVATGARRALVIMCGIPGSGKSTIARALSTRLPRNVHVEIDMVRAMVFRPTYEGDESRFVYSAAIEVARQGLMSGYSVVLDGTFPKEEFRRQALTTLDGVSSVRLVVHVVCDPGTALRRNRERTSAVPETTVTRIYRYFEAPRNALKVDTDEKTADEAASLIAKTLEERAGPS